MGPTASGKTERAVELVQQLPLEIISVDSALVYRHMDIGTAKPDAALRARAPHRLIDIRDPAQAYSAAEFRADALQAMTEITAAGRVPLLVGGTMLYFRALRRGLSALPGADAALRARLDEEGRRHGWAHLHRRLAGVDPAAAARIHPNDPQRIQRALEVYELTGEPLSRLQAGGGGPRACPYRILTLGLLDEDRAALHQRIARRFEAMLRAGFVEEVEALRRRGDLHPELPALRAVGYRQVWEYLDGKSTRDEMVQRGVAATRQLAKRQITWLRAEPALQPLAPAAADVAQRLRGRVQEWLGA